MGYLKGDIEMRDLPHHKTTYILTCSLGDKAQMLTNIGIKVPKISSGLYAEIQASLAQMIEGMIPDTQVRTIPMSELASDILTRARGELENGTFVVSTCLEIAVPTRGATLEINRIINEQGDIIGFGPRPGHQPLKAQVEAITRLANGRPMAIVEDGSFTGKTLCTVLDMFEKAGASVNAIILGFAFPKAIEALTARVNGSVHTVEVMAKDELLDWMPDHDFLAWTPNCGRTFGIEVGGQIQPFYTAEGCSYAAPYVRPFGNPTDWASIPKEKAHRFSVDCLSLASDFYREVARLNNGLTVGQLTQNWSRVSVPYYVGANFFPTTLSDTIEHSIRDAKSYLHEEC